ncbi:15431_t:CDS:2, partial [Gigaspora margarita]
MPMPYYDYALINFEVDFSDLDDYLKVTQFFVDLCNELLTDTEEEKKNMEAKYWLAYFLWYGLGAEERQFILTK